MEGSHAPHPMDLATPLLQMARLLEASAEAVAALNAMRARYSDEEWAALEEAHPLVGDLLGAASSIEDILEGGTG